MNVTAVNAFENYRSKLTGLAYRITGSIAEAEDIVQETFLKWNDADINTIRSPASWLAKVTTRLSLDHLKSASVQREAYIGPWLPEPFVADREIPENEYELDQSITMALLVLLDQLTPAERAAFILHDIFHFNFNEVAEILDKSDASCRKLASRARKKIDRDGSHPKAGKDEHHRIVVAFLTAVKQGNMRELIGLLQENVILHTDGGGKVLAVPRILQGSAAVGKFLIKVVTRAFTEFAPEDFTVNYTWFNGSPGFVVWHGREPDTAYNMEIEGGTIRKIHVLRNPDKLKFFKTAR